MPRPGRAKTARCGWRSWKHRRLGGSASPPDTGGRRPDIPFKCSGLTGYNVTGQPRGAESKSRNRAANHDGRKGDAKISPGAGRPAPVLRLGIFPTDTASDRPARDHSGPLRVQLRHSQQRDHRHQRRGGGARCPQFRGVGKAEREAIANSIRQPVRFLVSSTFHNNYSKGNLAYADVWRIGHESYRSDLLALMQRDKVPAEEQKTRLPNETFRDRVTLYLGGKEIQIRYLGRGHTRGDSIIYVPQDRIAYLSELFFAEQFVYIDDGYGLDWLKTLDAVEGLGAEIFVPAHGPIPADPRETRHQLDRFRQMLVDIRDAVQKEVALGATEDQAVATVRWSTARRRMRRVCCVACAVTAASALDRAWRPPKGWPFHRSPCGRIPYAPRAAMPGGGPLRCGGSPPPPNGSARLAAVVARFVAAHRMLFEDDHQVPGSRNGVCLNEDISSSRSRRTAFSSTSLPMRERISAFSVRSRASSASRMRRRNEYGAVSGSPWVRRPSWSAGQPVPELLSAGWSW